MQTKRILVVLGDLFFAPSVESALGQLGYTPDVRHTDAPPDGLGEPPPALLILELDAPQAVWEPLARAAQAAGVPTLGYGPHVDLDLRQRALGAGVTQVVGRSTFATQLPGLVQRLAGPPRT